MFGSIRVLGTMVITGAMGRHLRSYPHARFPDHEDLLRHPLLDDHLSKGNSEAYPRGGVCELCVMFQLFVLSCLSCSTLDFNLSIHSCMLFNSYKFAEK